MQSVDAHITSHWSRVNSDQLTIVKDDNSCVTYMLNAMYDWDKENCVERVTKVLHTMRLDKPRSVKDIKFGYCGEMLTVEGTVEAHTRIIREFIKSNYILLRLEKGQVVLVFTYNLIRLPRDVPWASFPQLQIDFVDYVCLSQDQLNDLNMQKLPFFKRDLSLLAVRDCRKFSSLSHEDDHEEYMENLFKKLPRCVFVCTLFRNPPCLDLLVACFSQRNRRLVPQQRCSGFRFERRLPVRQFQGRQTRR